jgi:membrane associated rhomboid family serine protease
MEPLSEERRFTGLLPELLRAPVTGITCVAAIVLTVLWWTKIGAADLLMDSRAFETQPWRLVTSTLLHGNVIHLLFNLTWTWRLGRDVESRIGAWRTAALFLILAVVPAAAEFAVFQGGVGLSGLLYGLFGFVWVLGSRDPKWGGVIDRKTVQIFIFWFFLCIALTLAHLMPIGNMAHAAGWGLGALIGRAVAAPASNRPRWIAAIVAASAAVGLAASIGRPLVNRSGAVEWDWAYRGYVELEAGRDARAADFLRRALARDGKETDWWLNLEIAYRNLGSESEAIDALDHAVRLNPDDPHVRVSRAVSKFSSAYKANEEGRLGDAIALYEESVALDGAKSDTWYNLGIAYQTAERYDEAIKAYETALRLDPQQPNAREALDDVKHR